jgi:hypothetical protein
MSARHWDVMLSATHVLAAPSAITTTTTTTISTTTSNASTAAIAMDCHLVLLLLFMRVLVLTLAYTTHIKFCSFLIRRIAKNYCLITWAGDELQRSG